MKYASCMIVGVLALACLTTARAETYTGSLLYTPPLGGADGIIVGDAGGLWAASNVALSWTVTNADNSYPGYPWRYEYHVTQESGQAGFSHLTIETSGGLSDSNLTGLAGATILSVGNQKTQSGNPAMPADVYGIRFAPINTPGDWTFSFYADRMPVWGDFYTKGGNDNYAYNRGFTAGDLDPANPPANGSVDYHILRPDTHAPEPATIVNLLGLGVVALGAYLWRRRKPGDRLA